MVTKDEGAALLHHKKPPQHAAVTDGDDAQRTGSALADKPLVVSGIELTEGRREHIGAVADVTWDLPLLQRYGVTREGLCRDLMAALDRGEGLVVAVCEGVPVGFAWFLERGTFGMGSYLKLIAVGRQYHGFGIGSRLLRAVEQCASRSSRALFLLVSDFNKEAQRFYARHGYLEAGVLKDFVRPGIDERVYWKKLN